MSEADLTPKPPGWLPWHLWREDFEENYRKREGIRLVSNLPDNHESAFESEARERYDEYLDQLAAPDLSNSDLRNANVFRAFLPSADLRAAKMQGADLRAAKMQGADLSGADLQGAYLQDVKMRGANLT
ncbi:MAG: pentapeptide repeat-containing protein, partial [Paracoccaceae bacterium]|nr:pentapeptide repeat-containing protein [Paracoccaceae bacterium]